MAKRYPLIIIGGGSAGFAAATRANDKGIKTAMINSGPIGGTCVNVGCVPSKYLLESTNFYTHARKPPFEGVGPCDSTLDFAKMMAGKSRLVEGLRESNYRRVLADMRSVTLYEGRATFVGVKSIRVGREALEAEKILIAVGARPTVPVYPGIEEVGVLTSDDLLELREPPESMIVVGGRALALEFAQVFSRLGSKVTLLQRSDRILPQHEPAVSEALARYLTGEGVNIHTGVMIDRLSKDEDLKRVEATVNGKHVSFDASEILFATGRKPDLDGLGLGSAGVETLDGFVKVDEYCRTSNPSVYAAGDCAVGGTQLETLAAKMGNAAVRNAFEGASVSINLREIPSVVFTDPQVAAVGYTEEEYMERMGHCSCRTVEMGLVPKAQIIRDARGLVKVVVDPKTKRLVGGQIVAHNAAELIHELTIAVKFGLTIDDVIGTTHVFPTMSEGIKKACQAFYRDVSKMSCCIE